jgi:hypothetical protein
LFRFSTCRERRFAEIPHSKALKHPFFFADLILLCLFFQCLRVEEFLTVVLITFSLWQAATDVDNEL